jgi:hypothetical protein
MYDFACLGFGKISGLCWGDMTMGTYFVVNLFSSNPLEQVIGDFTLWGYENMKA